MIASTLRSTRNPSGNHVYSPLASCRMHPARSSSTWLGISASAGLSLSVGMRVSVARIDCVILGQSAKDNRDAASPERGPQLPGTARRAQSRVFSAARLIILPRLLWNRTGRRGRRE